MNKKDFEEIGVLVFGKAWTGAMAEYLGLCKKTVDLWVRGVVPMPGNTKFRGKHKIDNLKPALYCLLKQHEKKIQKKIEKLKK